jgi:hypothetical protein
MERAGEGLARAPIKIVESLGPRAQPLVQRRDSEEEQVKGQSEGQGQEEGLEFCPPWSLCWLWSYCIQRTWVCNREEGQKKKKETNKSGF